MNGKNIFYFVRLGEWYLRNIRFDPDEEASITLTKNPRTALTRTTEGAVESYADEFGGEVHRFAESYDAVTDIPDFALTEPVAPKED